MLFEHSGGFDALPVQKMHEAAECGLQCLVAGRQYIRPERLPIGRQIIDPVEAPFHQPEMREGGTRITHRVLPTLRCKTECCRCDFGQTGLQPATVAGHILWRQPKGFGHAAQTGDHVAAASVRQRAVGAQLVDELGEHRCVGFDEGQSQRNGALASHRVYVPLDMSGLGRTGVDRGSDSGKA
ncbi:hypothetical protein [Ruegeria sp. HKCCD7296]|uniref:hypothetical protein n=1 Tax=Ruegeria sp. HKCCD7296 TaxID=2683012 RepID=UPI0014931F21|nr:hypothetical protein [Ruegeria sp. HKCCD7296]NOD33432.1 hypothetical protein [Ruegeria sp. HKCCD7296]